MSGEEVDDSARRAREGERTIEEPPARECPSLQTLAARCRPRIGQTHDRKLLRRTIGHSDPASRYPAVGEVKMPFTGRRNRSRPETYGPGHEPNSDFVHIRHRSSSPSCGFLFPLGHPPRARELNSTTSRLTHTFNDSRKIPG